MPISQRVFWDENVFTFMYMFLCIEAITADAWILLISNFIIFKASLNSYIPRCCNSI